MARYVAEPARKIPVSGEYDVVVVGGGIAGVAAAVAAARNGRSVCLLEKENALGGLATLGLVIIYLPLCDGLGRQVMKGISEEMLKLSVKDGTAHRGIPDCWRRGGDKSKRAEQRYQTTFNAASYIMLLDQYVLKAGVKLMFDTRFCDVVKKGRKIDSVIIENKSGRSAIKCKAVVDCSGDADVCFMAGEKTDSLNTNVAAGWYYTYDGGELKYHQLTRPYDPQALVIPDKGRGYRIESPDDVTDMSVDGRFRIMEHLKKMRKATPGKVISPVLLPTIPCFRMTRRLKTEVEVEATDTGRYFDDAIGMTGHWYKKGPVYYIPYRSLTASKTTNLLAAGRCMGVGQTGWDIFRVIPTCAVTGEAAGVAAAMSIEKKCAVTKLNVADLQARLKKQKVLINKKFVGANFEGADGGGAPVLH